MQRYKNLAVLLLVLLIVIAGGTVLYKKLYKKPITKENVVVTTAENTDAEGVNKILKLFPEGLPFDSERVVESFSSDYADHSVVQSGVSYLSGKEKSELYEEYQIYLIENHFVIDATSNNADQGTLIGTKDNDDLSVAISENNGVRIVRLAFTDRK
jgi:hypothetical protein